MLSKPLTKTLLRTTDNYIKALEKGGIKTISDLLHHFPREYDDRTEVLDTFSVMNIQIKNTILVTLKSAENQRTANNKTLTKAIIEDKNGFLSECVWFNRKFLSTQLKPLIGKKILITGKVKYAYGKISFPSPEFESDLSKIGGEIVPVYSDMNYIPSKWTVSKMHLLKQYISEIPENLPEDIIKKYDFISRKQAIHDVHFPKNNHQIEVAKYRLAYEELFEINYRAIASKYETFQVTEGRSVPIPLNAELIKNIIAKLPFDLTDHQKIVLFQILKDMEKNHSMQRLLEGDVGTGKTIVALISVIHGILESGKLNQEEATSPPAPLLQERGVGNSRIQVAIMAPTEILARQHFSSMQSMLFEFGISSDLLVGSTTAKNKKDIKSKLKSGNLDVIIGTHALVQEDVYFKNLGYVIIDEQHRFGVKQREVLEKGFGNARSNPPLSLRTSPPSRGEKTNSPPAREGLGEETIIPHSLNMTATPIPRTLALTLYGDQDLSVISQYPKNRKEIFTKVAKTENQRHEIERFVRSEIEKGRQVFWVSPLVEESEKIDLANAISTYESLVDIFAPFQVGLIHGKMKPKEKDQIMKDFSENRIQVLSSTSVIEVGIDVPNSTIMCIEGAERFGLSQLHQFRGRVGRGSHQSYCYLFPTKGNDTDRLKAMERTNNGFELSEIDLEIRGPGEVYGFRQSGVPDLKIADLGDLELISQIREDIEEMFETKKKD